MKRLSVRLKKRSYHIVIGEGLLAKAGELLKELSLGECAYIVTNRFLKDTFGAQLEDALHKSGFKVVFRVIPDTEKSKSLSVMAAIVHGLVAVNKLGKPFIIAFGGGVIGDVAGFAASIYKRGIPYVQIPTTLLAQVDSSIGGKTAVDLPEGKNLIGAFYQPRLVLSDTALLKKLGIRQVRSGLAEIIKYGIIKDAVLFHYLEKHMPAIKRLDPQALEYIITHSSRIKASIVEKDERETRSIRTILNFGHTIGHAIETAGGYRSYTHGEAIALGMLTAADISHTIGLCDKHTAQRISALITQAGLPGIIRGVRLEDVIKAHYLDKKFSGKTNRFVLIEKIGKTVIRENLPLEVIKAAVETRLKR